MIVDTIKKINNIKSNEELKSILASEDWINLKNVGDKMRSLLLKLLGGYNEENN